MFCFFQERILSTTPPPFATLSWSILIWNFNQTLCKILKKYPHINLVKYYETGIAWVSSLVKDNNISVVIGTDVGCSESDVKEYYDNVFRVLRPVIYFIYLKLQMHSNKFVKNLRKGKWSVGSLNNWAKFIQGAKFPRLDKLLFILLLLNLE